ncbi:MAG: hypothetical protein J5930_11305 [Treponema sp.]|nr:hypothetical protein [Treponema sp.]
MQIEEKDIKVGDIEIYSNRELGIIHADTVSDIREQKFLFFKWEKIKMRKSVVFYLLLIVLSAFSSATEPFAPEPDIVIRNIDDFSIGKYLHELNVDIPDFYSPHRSIIVDSTFSFPYVRVLSDGVIYDVCYDWNSIIRYIAVETSDGGCFSTPEGIRMNMTYKDVVKITRKKKLKKERLVGYYMELPSGWYVSFWTGKSGTDYYPKDDDVVYAIFKRN